MPKKLIKRFMPDQQVVRNHKYLQFLGERLHDPNLWHLNRRSASGAFAVGLFMAFVPVPFQMVFAAVGALWFRVNLPISVALVWITNPITIPAIFYATYRLGNLLIGRAAPRQEFEFSYQWLTHELHAIWPPFLLGSLVTAALASLLGYLMIRALWRVHVIRHWRDKRKTQEPKSGDGAAGIPNQD